MSRIEKINSPQIMSLARRCLPVIMGLVLFVLSAFPFALLINLIDLKLVKPPYFDGPGVIAALGSVAGYFLLIAAVLVWIGLVIFADYYFFKGLQTNTLIRKLALVSSVVFYFYPAVVLIYQIVFETPLLAYQRVLPVFLISSIRLAAAAGFLAGSICLFFTLYCNKNIRRYFLLRGRL